ncbi:pilus assembly protein PilY [Duganella callida]|uniref:Pilus assembly protein PilY n=2 Tax=Duganella callida TaxID=2561932 RepID=A0A4Y9SHJ2_9BURK|nr:pilus assembly protein PilY [Duganella callida]
MRLLSQFALLLPMCIGGCPPTYAQPPMLNIDSWPVSATCSPAPPGTTGPTGQAHGASLLRAATTTGALGELYQASLGLADWSGHFSRYLLSPAGGAGVVSTLAWDAGAILTGGTPAPDQRRIYTAIAQPNGALTMVPFTWATLAHQQRALLDLDDHAGESRVAYLRGDRSLEGTPFRRRSSILGDAIHSTPVYVGPTDRRSAVYLGANDGMLHAFDAISGEELFAYIPDALISRLAELTNPAYTQRAYVDGPAVAGTARLAGSEKTVLISAMGGGAQGVFALDVTDPAHFADGLGALWEFTDRDDPLMGNVITAPQIAKVRVQGASRDFAVVAGGLNSRADEGNGALFLLALDKPRDEGWQLNGNYYRIPTPISDKALANGLSAPVLLNDSDGMLRYAYAGDLQGNLWRFDFGGKAPWPDAIDKPLFSARDAGGRRQPISEQPLVAYSNSGGYIILFGTGKMIEKADRSAAAAATQSYYAIIDSLQTPPDTISGRSQLTQRFLDGSGRTLSISGMRMEAGSKGWYVDFIGVGERSVDTGVLLDGAVLFNTMLPGADICSPTRSRGYALNVLTGLANDGNVFAVLPNNEAMVGVLLPEYSARPVALPQSVSREPGNAPARMTQQKDYAIANVAAAGQVNVSAKVKSKRRAGRLSWREVANWRELHEAAK